MPQRQLEAHRDFTTKVVKLMIWYVWELTRRADPLPVEEALVNRVDIMRKTTLFDGRHPAMDLDPPIPEWEALKAQLEAEILSHGDRSRLDDLERACWEILSPYIVPTLEEMTSKHAELKDQPYRCWTYNIRETKPHSLNIHFANAYQPESPFRDRRSDLIQSLLRMVADARSENPELSEIECGSW